MIMKRITVHRTHILKDNIKGYMTIDGTNFSCYTLEAKSIKGHNPSNPIFSYALPLGVYKIKLKPYKFYPVCPFFECKPYINIGISDMEDSRIRPGCVQIGTKFIGERTLIGFEEVMNALEKIIKTDFKEWLLDSEIEFIEEEDCQSVEDGYEEEEENFDSYNFVNL